MSDIQNLTINKTVTITWSTVDEESQSCTTHRWAVTVEQVDGEDYFELNKQDSGLARFISVEGTATGKQMLQRSSWLSDLRTMRNTAAASQNGDSDELFGTAPKPSRWFKRKLKGGELEGDTILELKLQDIDFNDKVIPGITMKVKKSMLGTSKPFVQLSLQNLTYIRFAILASTKDKNNRREKCPIKLPKSCSWTKRKYKGGKAIRGVLAKKADKTKEKRMLYKFFPALEGDYENMVCQAELWMNRDDLSEHSDAQDSAHGEHDDDA